MSCTKTEVGMRSPVAAVEAMTSESLAVPASFQPLAPKPSCQVRR
jgi:hypothetical protein